MLSGTLIVSFSPNSRIFLFRSPKRNRNIIIDYSKVNAPMKGDVTDRHIFLRLPPCAFFFDWLCSKKA